MVWCDQSRWIRRWKGYGRQSKREGHFRLMRGKMPLFWIQCSILICILHILIVPVVVLVIVSIVSTLVVLLGLTILTLSTSLVRISSTSICIISTISTTTRFLAITPNMADDATVIASDHKVICSMWLTASIGITVLGVVCGFA